MGLDVTVGKIVLCLTLLGSVGNFMIWLFRFRQRLKYRYNTLHFGVSLIDVIRCATVGVFSTVLLLSNRQTLWVNDVCGSMGIIALLTMCSPGYILLAVLLEDCNVNVMFGGNKTKQKMLSFIIIACGFIFTTLTGTMPFIVGGGYEFVNHSVSCQPNKPDQLFSTHLSSLNSYVYLNGSSVHERDLLTLNISDVRVIRAPTEEPASEDHDLENVYHFFGATLIYWVCFAVTCWMLCKHFTVSTLEELKINTSSLLVLSYLLCFLPESISETMSALSIFNVIVLTEKNTSHFYENYSHVLMAVILPILSSAVNCCVHLVDIMRYPTMVRYEVPNDQHQRELKERREQGALFKGEASGI